MKKLIIIFFLFWFTLSFSFYYIGEESKIKANDSFRRVRGVNNPEGARDLSQEFGKREADGIIDIINNSIEGKNTEIGILDRKRDRKDRLNLISWGLGYLIQDGKSDKVREVIEGLRSEYGFLIVKRLQEIGGDISEEVYQLSKELGKINNIPTFFSALRFYEGSKILKEVKLFEGSNEDLMEVIEYLRENKQALGNNSLKYLMQSLWTGGKIPFNKLSTWRFNAGAADYAVFKRREFIEEKIREAWERMPEEIKYNLEAKERIIEYLNPKRFTQLKNPRRPVSERYFRMIIYWAMRYYGNELIEQLQTGQTFLIMPKGLTFKMV